MIALAPALLSVMLFADAIAKIDNSALSISIAIANISGTDRNVTYTYYGTERGRLARFHVVVSNRSNRARRILWGIGPGNYALSFEITDESGKTWVATKISKFGNMTRGWAEVGSKESLVYEVQFANDRVWSGFPVPEKHSNIVVTMRAVLGIDSREAKYGFWTGRVVSKPVRVTFRRP